MEVLEFVVRQITHRPKRLRLCIILLVIISAGAQVWNTCTQGVRGLELAPCQLMSLAIIFIWIWSAPFFYKQIPEVEELFSEEEYKELAQQYKQWIRHRCARGESGGFKVWKRVYPLIWFLCWGFELPALYRYQMLPCGVLGFSIGGLLLIAMLLNFSSYYTCVVYTYFLYRVSFLRGLRYNEYMPSATEGYQKLLRGAQRGSTVFLIVSMLFTVSGVIMMYRGLRYGAAVDLRGVDVGCLSLMAALVLFFGFGTFMALFLLPKILLRNLVRFWRGQSLHKFQGELYQAEDAGNLEKAERISQKIRLLMEDKVGLQFGLVEILVAVTTIVMNAVTIANFAMEVISGLE